MEVVELMYSIFPSPYKIAGFVQTLERIIVKPLQNSFGTLQSLQPTSVSLYDFVVKYSSIKVWNSSKSEYEHEPFLQRQDVSKFDLR